MELVDEFVFLQVETAQFLASSIIDIFAVLLTGPMFLRNIPIPRGETTYNVFFSPCAQFFFPFF